MISTVTGHLVHANGKPAHGAGVVFWPAFSIYGNTVAGGHFMFDVIDGEFSVDLYPNIPAQPANVYYTVKFELDSGPAYEEYWLIPDSPNLTIEQVRAHFPAAPGMSISPLQITGMGAEPGMILSWDGTAWRGGWVKIDNVDPNYIAFATGTAGADFNVTGSGQLGTTVTLNLPSASTTARGVVTTTDQTFSGNKWFANNLTVSGTFTSG